MKQQRQLKLPPRLRQQLKQPRQQKNESVAVDAGAIVCCSLWAAWVLAKDAHSHEALGGVLLGTIRKCDLQLGGVC
jgi:hypothetical protein